MRDLTKQISLVLLAIIILGSGAACSFFESKPSQEPGSTGFVDLSEGLVPLTQTPAVPIVLMPVASGSKVESNSKALIDYSNTADGYVMVKWLSSTTRQLRVQVTGPSKTTYTYVLLPNDTFEVFPLSDGNGSYTVGVFEQVDGSRYAQASSINFTVTLRDEFAPFLRPNQYVNFNKDNKVVEKAAELVTGKRTVTDKVAAVYDFVIKTLTYDTDLAGDISKGIVTGYLPDLDSVLARRKGICFDYASLMTAMLRSQQIPTKLVVGFTGDVKHAWINVYSEESGWIDNVIFFDGKVWTMMDPTFASSSTNSASLRAFIGDGSNYVTTNLY